MLGLHLGPLPEDYIADATGFIPQPTQRISLNGGAGYFAENPVGFFRRLYNMKRYDRPYWPTHMGQILISGRSLADKDFLTAG